MSQNYFQTLEQIEKNFDTKKSAYQFDIQNFKQMLGYLFIKYPQNYSLRSIESTPVNLQFENGQIKLQKIKVTKNKIAFSKPIFSQEFFNIDFKREEIDYQEQLISDNKNILIEQQKITKKNGAFCADFFYLQQKQKNFMKNMQYLDKLYKKLIDMHRKSIIKQLKNYEEEFDKLANYQSNRFKQFQIRQCNLKINKFQIQMVKIIDDSLNSMTEFLKECEVFIRNCSKPSQKEYIKISTSCALGFVIMGIIGYLVKLLFVPIHSILLSN